MRLRCRDRANRLGVLRLGHSPSLRMTSRFRNVGATLALLQRYGLRVVVEQVLDLDRVHADVNDLVTAVDDVALAGDEDVAILLQKDALGLAWFAGEAIELQVDGRRRTARVARTLRRQRPAG